MLARENRITSSKDFTQIKNKGKLFQSESFSICFIKREDDGPSRFGFIVSNKISPSATVRNKSKRALHEGVRYMLVYVKTGYDCVFLAKPIIIKKYTDVLMQEVKSAFAKANLLKES